MNSIPLRYKNAVIPHAMVKNADQAIAFYKNAFNAVELFRLAIPNGPIIHAELQIEQSTFMVGEAADPFGAPTNGVKPSVGLHIYVQDVDTTVKQAVDAGAELIQPAQDMFYGDRQATIKDPFGHIWMLLTHKEDLSESEIVARASEFFAKM